MATQDQVAAPPSVAPSRNASPERKSTFLPSFTCVSMTAIKNTLTRSTVAVLRPRYTVGVNAFLSHYPVLDLLFGSVAQPSCVHYTNIIGTANRSHPSSATVSQTSSGIQNLDIVQCWSRPYREYPAPSAIHSKAWRSSTARVALRPEKWDLGFCFTSFAGSVNLRPYAYSPYCFLACFTR